MDPRQPDLPARRQLQSGLEGISRGTFIARMGEGDVWPRPCDLLAPQHDLPQRLILPTPRDAAKPQAVILKNLGLAEIERDAATRSGGEARLEIFEWKSCELLLPAEGDVRRDQAVLHRIDDAPHGFDSRGIFAGEEERELAAVHLAPPE